MSSGGGTNDHTQVTNGPVYAPGQRDGCGGGVCRSTGASREQVTCDQLSRTLRLHVARERADAPLRPLAADVGPRGQRAAEADSGHHGSAHVWIVLLVPLHNHLCRPRCV